jgi:UDP-N-acetylmuramoyl-tripeptide--D-alanyl-D-alanine ligase
MENLFQLFYQSSGVSTDTRKIKKDSLYIALKGENFDGNTFAEKAIELGAKYAIVDNKDFANESSIFHVEDSLVFLQKLSNYHRKKIDIPLIGITGSNGKTTSKELINAVLTRKYNVLCTAGNLNNHIGVPLTLLNLTEDHQIAIIEMGANKPKDIEELCLIAEPNYGIITNVGKAHLQGFLSFEGVIETKSELYAFIKQKEGKLIINGDDEILNNKANSLRLEKITYGTNGENQIQGELVQLNPFVELRWKSAGYSSPIIQTNLVGKYNFFNFLAAITFGTIFKVENEKINEAISNYEPTNNRSQVQKTKENTLIIDCYNANPSSMQLALESFKEIQHPNKIAILGDMFELGIESDVEHQKIVDYCIENEIQFLTVGDFFQKHNSSGYKNTQEAIEFINSVNIKNNLILLKGSRGIALEKIIDFL